MNEWPDVPCDEYGQMTCPVPGCGEPLYLNRLYSIPLIAEQGLDHEPKHAVSDSWEVECVHGHRIYNNTDLAAAIGEDTTCETAVEYDHLAVHAAVNALIGDRL